MVGIFGRLHKNAALFFTQNIEALSQRESEAQSAVVNDSPVDCQSSECQKSPFSTLAPSDEGAVSRTG